MYRRSHQQSSASHVQNNSSFDGQEVGDDDPRGRSNKQPTSLYYKSILILRSPKTLILVLCALGLIIELMIKSRVTVSTTTITRRSNGNVAASRIRKKNTSRQHNGKLRGLPTIADELKIQAPIPEEHPSIDEVGTTSPFTNATIHIVFSTDCSPFQHWQSYLFFHSALTVNQPGYITRIASGCTQQQLQYERQWHTKYISNKMSTRFRIHFTPKFSSLEDKGIAGREKGEYRYFNKPFGLKHFLEHNELMGIEVDDDEPGNNKRMKHPNDVIVLADPDFLLLRPLTDDFSTVVESHSQSQSKRFVRHGQPFAQRYFLEEDTFLRKPKLLNLTAVTGQSDSLAVGMDKSIAIMHYGAGPPYMGTANDMYNIATTWVDFVPRVHAQYPPAVALFAEMYAYCIAAMHLRLPHILIDDLGIRIAGSGWNFIKQLHDADICDDDSTKTDDNNKEELPWAIHYSQQYTVGKYSWGKRNIPHDIFTCQHPMLVEPPLDLGPGRYIISYIPDGKNHNSKPQKLPPRRAKIEAFLVCKLTKATNDAMEYFKRENCENENANLRKSYNMWAGKDVG